MRSFLLIATSFLALTLFSVAAQAAEEKQKEATKPEQWRYVRHRGLWWYWLPEGRWVYWQHDRWNDLSSSVKCGPATASASARSGEGTRAGGFTLSAFERETGQSSTATYGTPRMYRQGASDSAIGPRYGHQASSVGYPMISRSAEVGPFYGKADSSVRYPPLSGGVEVGPFYGKADSSAGSEVDRSRFPDY